MTLATADTTSSSTSATDVSALPITDASSSPSTMRQSSSIAQLLRGVAQSVSKRRKRREHEKFLRALEKSGVDFADALLRSSQELQRRSTVTSATTASSQSGLSMHSTSRRSSQTRCTRSSATHGDATRALERIEKLQVRSTVQNMRERVTLVTLQLVLAPSAPSRRDTSAQQQQTEQLLRGSTVASVVVFSGIRQQQQRAHDLTRPFDDFRKLRKMLAFCVRRGRHDEEREREYDERKPVECEYCSHVRAYVEQCWERPPLLETSMLSSMSVIRKGVLASSLLHFVRLATPEPVFPPQLCSGTTITPPAVATTTCGAHLEIATILHDFLRLQLAR